MVDFYYSWSKQSLAPDFPVVGARDDRLLLADGREVYDFISTSFQASFGHSHAGIIRAINRQLDVMPIASPKTRFDLKQNVSRRLLDAIGLGGGKLFYTVSGAESVENALKIARQVTGRPLVAARRKSYHGASLGALSVTGDWRNAAHRTLNEWTIRIPEHDQDPDLTETERCLDSVGTDQVAAVILETISGTNGMSIPPPTWLAGIQELCRNIGAMLILDEVLVGFHRCGPMFAFQDYHLCPDMVCMAKAISGGYIPFGAVWTSPAIARHYDNQTLACGLTNYGHPLALAAVEAVLDTLSDPSFQRHQSELETEFARRIDEIARLPIVQTTRHRGLMAAIELTVSAPTWAQAIAGGLHLYSSGNLIILAPPYVSTRESFDTAFSRLVDLLQNHAGSETPMPEANHEDT